MEYDDLTKGPLKWLMLGLCIFALALWLVWALMEAAR